MSPSNRLVWKWDGETERRERAHKNKDRGNKRERERGREAVNNGRMEQQVRGRRDGGSERKEEVEVQEISSKFIN